MSRRNIIFVLAAAINFASVAALASPFDGTWNSNCYSQSAQGQTEYAKDQLTVSGTAMGVDSAIYSDSSCGQSAIATIHTGETIALSPSTTGTAGVQNVDLQLTGLTLTFHDSTYIEYMNTESFCGYSNWAVDQAQDVTGKSCGGQTMPSAGTQNYDIMGVGTDGNLYMGLVTTTLTGASPDKRPTALDTSIIYSKAARALSAALLN